jgi:hypothetical protein
MGIDNVLGDWESVVARDGYYRPGSGFLIALLGPVYLVENTNLTLLLYRCPQKPGPNAVDEQCKAIGHFDIQHAADVSGLWVYGDPVFLKTEFVDIELDGHEIVLQAVGTVGNVGIDETRTWTPSEAWVNGYGFPLFSYPSGAPIWEALVYGEFEVIPVTERTEENRASYRSHLAPGFLVDRDGLPESTKGIVSRYFTPKNSANQPMIVPADAPWNWVGLTVQMEIGEAYGILRIPIDLETSVSQIDLYQTNGIAFAAVIDLVGALPLLNYHVVGENSFLVKLSKADGSFGIYHGSRDGVGENVYSIVIPFRRILGTKEQEESTAPTARSIRAKLHQFMTVDASGDGLCSYETEVQAVYSSNPKGALWAGCIEINQQPRTSAWTANDIGGVSGAVIANREITPENANWTYHSWQITVPGGFSSSVTTLRPRSLDFDIPEDSETLVISSEIIEPFYLASLREPLRVYCARCSSIEVTDASVTRIVAQKAYLGYFAVTVEKPDALTIKAHCGQEEAFCVVSDDRPSDNGQYYVIQTDQGREGFREIAQSGSRKRLGPLQPSVTIAGGSLEYTKTWNGSVDIVQLPSTDIIFRLSEVRHNVTGALLGVKIAAESGSVAIPFLLEAFLGSSSSPSGALALLGITLPASDSTDLTWYFDSGYLVVNASLIPPDLPGRRMLAVGHSAASLLGIADTWPTSITCRWEGQTIITTETTRADGSPSAVAGASSGVTSGVIAGFVVLSVAVGALIIAVVFLALSRHREMTRV